MACRQKGGQPLTIQSVDLVAQHIVKAPQHLSSSIPIGKHMDAHKYAASRWDQPQFERSQHCCQIAVPIPKVLQRAEMQHEGPVIGHGVALSEELTSLPEMTSPNAEFGQHIDSDARRICRDCQRIENSHGSAVVRPHRCGDFR